jgi:hypothetical protein
LHTLLGFIAIEVSVVDNSCSFAHGDGGHTDDGLFIVSPSFPPY